MSIHEKLSGFLKETANKIKKDQVDLIMSYEQGELSDEDTIELFADLVKTGMAWKLQGSYGRTAKALIDSGYISKDGKVLKTECIKESKTATRKKDYEEYVNEIEIPEHDKKSNGGRIPDKSKYGTWLRKNDPIAFNVGYNEWVSEGKHRESASESVTCKKTVNEAVDADIQKVIDIVKDNKFLSLRKPLENAGFKKVDFSYAGGPHYDMKTKSGKTILVVNKKYVENDPSVTIVGDFAVGYQS